MRKIKLLILFAIGVIFISSCSVTNSTTSKTLDIDGVGVVPIPTIVDLDIKENKVSGEAIGTNTSINKIKQDAIAVALEKVNADILIEPIYKIKTTNGRTTVNVSGFPATYKNFRSMTKEDVELFDTSNNKNLTKKVEVAKPNNKEQVIVKKKNPAAAVLAVLGLFIAVGLVTAAIITGG